MSFFITFEGCEGSGKSSQSKMLYDYLKSFDLPVILTREPGGTSVGEEIARLLKWADAGSINPLTELMLFNASRAQLVSDVIKPALGEDKIVICDRYTDSTMAYQGYGRGLSFELVEKINNITSGGLKPDLTIFLNIVPKESFSRMNGENDRIERERQEFHERVYHGFHKLIEREPKRWMVVEAGMSKEQVALEIRKKVQPLIVKYKTNECK